MEIKKGAEFKTYLLQTKLGDGASGEVWKARDMSQPRSVAVKIMRDYLSQSQNPIHRERFNREIAAMKLLGEHPNIPAFFDGDGNFILPYFVMQFIGGEGMDTILDTGAIKNISALKRMDIISQISDALSFAHNAGYIHRDIKPGNIKIIGDDTAFLMDFSVAFEEENSTETQLGIGTPLYMPPEVYPSRAGDIFSLALVAYEILYGIHAVFRPTDRITTAAEAKGLMDQRLRDKTWNHPSHSSMLQNLNVDLEAVDKVFVKALSYKADDRYQDAQDFSNDLRRAVGLEPINARPRTLIVDRTFDELSQETPIYISNVAPSSQNREATILTSDIAPQQPESPRKLMNTAAIALIGVLLITVIYLFLNQSDDSEQGMTSSTATLIQTNSPSVLPTEEVAVGATPTRKIIPLSTRTSENEMPTESSTELEVEPTLTDTLSMTDTPAATPTATDIPISLNFKENLQDLFEIVNNPDEYRCLRFNELYKHFDLQRNEPDTLYAEYGEELVGEDSPMTFIYDSFCSKQTSEPTPLSPLSLETYNDELVRDVRFIVSQLR